MTIRYWLHRNNLNYEISSDDMTRYGYMEVTERPSPYSEAYRWNNDKAEWELNHEAAIKTIAERRFEVENGGVYYSNKRFDTSDRGKILLHMTRCRCANLPVSATIKWKFDDNDYGEFTALEMLTIIDKVAEFIGACYDHEAELVNRIIRKDFSMEELNSGWPKQIIEI